MGVGSQILKGKGITTIGRVIVHRGNNRVNSNMPCIINRRNGMKNINIVRGNRSVQCNSVTVGKGSHILHSYRFILYFSIMYVICGIILYRITDHLSIMVHGVVNYSSAMVLNYGVIGRCGISRKERLYFRVEVRL